MPNRNDPTYHQDPDPSLASLSAQVKEIHDQLQEHIMVEETMMSSAFPGGDYAEHRKAHEAMMRAAAAQEKFWDDLRMDIAKKGVLAFLIFVFGLIVIGAAVKLGIKP